MDVLFIIHLSLTLILLSIPFWSLEYLTYGIYIPLIISITWLFFNGCPLTKIQHIESETFTQEILKPVIPSITSKQTEHLNTFILLFITVIGFNKLKSYNIGLNMETAIINN